MPRTLLALMLSFQLMAAELPVRKVILYKHGIGFFERAGEIPVGQSARLDFKADQMNDVLKSLTVFDQTGNSIAGVRYDSSMPLAAKLNEFPFKLGDRSPLTDFIDQIKGAAITLKFGQNTLEGQVMGARLSPGREPSQPATEFLNLLEKDGDLRTVDLSAVTSIRLADPELQRQLSEYLRSMNAARSREQKSVYIDSARDAARKLNVNYTIPMPVWKSSYRLVLDAGTAKKPQLEGWAIIDNTTNEDWTNVNLSVISGKPISFVSRLYEPKFIQRQVAELADEAPVAPPVYKAAAAPAPGGARMRVAPEGNAMMDAQAGMQFSRVAESTLTIATETREAGELFEYRFDKPVTVKRNESAMLPFIQQEMNARKLLIYTEDSNTENPFNSVELTNSTGKTLDGGPLSVYEGGVYAGEALVNTFKAGDKRLISYAQDLGTRVVEDSEGGARAVREIKAERGILTQRFVSERKTTYRITNVDKKPKTLIIEHAINERTKLLSPKPAEQTKTHYRFEVKLTGEPTQSLTVAEEETMSESTSISSMGDEMLILVSSNARLTPDAKRILGEIMTLRRQQADSGNAIKNLNAQIKEATEDSDRVRRNLASFQSVSGQQERVQRYATDLANLDARIVSLRDQVTAETKKRDDLSRQIAQKIEAASF
jgi:hypothetical protein